MDTLSGPATACVLRRQHQVFGDARFERLATLSVGHLYNLRASRTYALMSVISTRTEAGGADTIRTGAGDKIVIGGFGADQVVLNTLNVVTLDEGDTGNPALEVVGLMSSENPVQDLATDTKNRALVKVLTTVLEAAAA
jgi:hypothetical protein